MRRRSVPDFPPICLGFIFCGIFSNLGATGCRRGRTPERPLRQPSQGLADQSQTFSCSGTDVTRVNAAALRQGRTRLYGRRQRSQIGIAKCCAQRKIALYGGERLVSVSLSNATGAERQGEGLRRHPMCLLRSRVRSPNSAGRRLAGNVPGEAEVEEPADLSHVRDERVPG